MYFYDLTTPHPVWWLRFFRHCWEQATENNNDIGAALTRNLSLSNAKMIYAKDFKNYLQFESESDFTLFVLKWS